MADSDNKQPASVPSDDAAAEVPTGTDAAAEAKKAKAKAKKAKAKAKKKATATATTSTGASSSSSSTSSSGEPVWLPGIYEPVGASSSAPASALLVGEEASAELRHFAESITLPAHDPSVDPDASKLIKKTAAPAEAVSHRFWSTQPVIQSSGAVQHNAAIDRPKTIADIDVQPVPLKGGLEWVVTDITNPNTLDEIYTLLTENYVEDDDNMFRFDYSKDFLSWALMPPGYLKQWHIGITWKGKLMAFISAIPAVLHVYNTGVPLVEINFLCVNKKLRSKRLAPTLIQEITRRVNLTGIWQAVYTAGRVLPTPVSVCRYYHRSLNPKKLIDVGFSHLAPRMTMARTIKLYKLPDHPQIPGIRALEAGDVAETCALLQQALAKYKIAPHFSEADFAHWFLPRAGVIQSYVVQEPQNNRITDFISFYLLPSTIIGNANYNTLNAAYSFYNFSTATEWKVLMNDGLILAKNLGCDVFNALDLMENVEFLKELKFGIGDGSLHYYLYNWQCPSVLSKDLGLVLM